MNDIRIITLDLDGTLLTSNKTITNDTFDALKRASDSGIQIVPCTGRFYEAMPECIKDLSFVNYCINCNGANIFDIKNNNSIYKAEMSTETSLQVLDYLESINAASDAYIDNWGYMNREYYENISSYIENPFYIKSVHDYRKPVDSLREYIKTNGLSVQKLQYFSSDYEIIQKGFIYLSENFPQCEITSSGYDDCEINDKKATKGIALHVLAEYLGVDITQTMSFGDSGNDISMIVEAGIGVAMGNAKTFIKEASDYVTLSNDEDGIVYAMKKFIF